MLQQNVHQACKLEVDLWVLTANITHLFGRLHSPNKFSYFYAFTSGLRLKSSPRRATDFKNKCNVVCLLFKKNDPKLFVTDHNDLLFFLLMWFRSICNQVSKQEDKLILVCIKMCPKHFQKWLC